MRKPPTILQSERELQAFCEDMLTTKGINTSDKLQFVSLEAIKTHFVSLWDSLKVNVFSMVERIIAEHTTSEDLVLRFREDKYIIIFSKADLAEAKTIVAAIMNEISQQYFHDHESKARDNSGKNRALSANSDPIEGGNPLNCTYTPLWDVQRNALISYLCLAQGASNLGDPFDRHEALFMGEAPSKILELDITVLKTVAYEIQDLLKRNGKLFIICPVHYETLSRRESHDRYIQVCQRIPDRHKKFLIFLIIGIPEKIHGLNMCKFFGSLTKHCNAIYGQVPLNSNLDFHTLSNSHFSVIGVRLKKVKGGEKKMIDDLAAFNQAAKKSGIKNVFALDVSSLSITTSSVCAGFDLLGGTAIHENVMKPNNAYRFMHQDLFTDMITEHRAETA